MFKGALYGGISGLAGGTVGSAIGGGLGSFVGGAVGSAVNAKLYGATGSDIGKSAIFGGIMAFGLYHLSSYINYEFKGGKKWGEIDISYKQFITMQADFQRSRFWGKEYGGSLMNDGSVKRFPAKTRANYQINGAKDVPNSKGWYHTHWDKPGQLISMDEYGNVHHVNASDYYVGERVKIENPQFTERYHSPTDLANASRSIVINRYDGSYFPGSGNHSNVLPRLLIDLCGPFSLKDNVFENYIVCIDSFAIKLDGSTKYK